MWHALVAMALPGSDPVQKVSIIPRGVAALGYTIQRPIEDRFLMSVDELENKLAVLMAGRAAESIFFDHVSTGAADDLAKATDIARNMVARFGMDTTLGQVAYESDPSPFLGPSVQPQWHPRWYSEQTAAKIDAAVRTIVDDAFQRAVSLLRLNRDLLAEGANALLSRETLGSSELEAYKLRLAAGPEPVSSKLA